MIGGDDYNRTFVAAVEQVRLGLETCRTIPDRNKELLNEIDAGLDELLHTAEDKDAEFWASSGSELFDELRGFQEAIAAEGRR